MLDNHIRINTAIYTSEYDEIQLTVSRSLGALSVVQALTNAGRATINGVEVELTYIPIDNLMLHFTGNHIEANYKEFMDLINGEPIDRSEEEFSRLPGDSYSLSAQYNWQTGVGEIVPRIAVYYTSDIYIGLDYFAANPEFDEYSTLDEYMTVNARVAWFPTRSEGLELAAYVNNATDENYYTGGKY